MQQHVWAPSTRDEVRDISSFIFYFFLHTLIDLTPVFSYVSLTFARKWLILAVWDLIRLGAVYKLNCSLRLTGCLFTVFTPDMHYDLGCVCVCVCVHKWVSIDIMSAPDGYSEHFFFFFFFSKVGSTFTSSTTRNIRFQTAQHHRREEAISDITS